MAKKKRGYDPGDDEVLVLADDTPADVGTVWGEPPTPAPAPTPTPTPECVYVDVGDGKVYRMPRRVVVWTPGPGAPERSTYADDIQVGQVVVDEATGRRFTVAGVCLGHDDGDGGGLKLV